MSYRNALDRVTEPEEGDVTGIEIVSMYGSSSRILREQVDELQKCMDKLRPYLRSAAPLVECGEPHILPLEEFNANLGHYLNGLKVWLEKAREEEAVLLLKHAGMRNARETLQ